MLEDFGEEHAREAPRRRGWFRRHRVGVILLTLVLVLFAAVAGYAFHLNSQLADIPRFDLDEQVDRPDRPALRGEGGYSILLVGVDNPDASGVQEAVEDDLWVPGVYRSDAMLLVHVDSDGRDAQVVSVPRDSYVPVPGYGRTKINAAFSYGGPGLLLRTMEDLLQTRIDHVAVIDVAGFGALTDDFGGVPVRLDRPLQVPATGETIPPGRRDLDGEAVIRYVRERKNLPRGDFDRVQRQQEVLRGIAGQVLQPGTLANPLKVSDLVQLTTRYVVVDAGLTPSAIRSLAWRSKGLRASSVRFLTVPNGGSATIDGASVVLVDPAELRAMFDLVEEDNFESWLGEHYAETDVLGGSGFGENGPP